jgi:hypothetical protein
LRVPLPEHGRTTARKGETEELEISQWAATGIPEPQLTISVVSYHVNMRIDSNDIIVDNCKGHLLHEQGTVRIFGHLGTGQEGFVLYERIIDAGDDL